MFSTHTNTNTIVCFNFNSPTTHNKTNISSKYTNTQSTKHSTRISGAAMEISGSDGMGREFKSPDEMWKQETGDEQKKGDWYRNGVGYWQVSCYFFF